jgi:hypothetical protein
LALDLSRRDIPRSPVKPSYPFKESTFWFNIIGKIMVLQIKSYFRGYKDFLTRKYCFIIITS